MCIDTNESFLVWIITIRVFEFFKTGGIKNLYPLTDEYCKICVYEV